MPVWIIVLALTAIRVGALIFDQTDLFVDESQYWLWGQELAFGYFSKPPMIGWVLHLFDYLNPNNLPWLVRIPAPLFHAAAALILARIVARVFPDVATAPALATAIYLSSPIVAVGSYLISTDTIMIPFLLGSIWMMVLARDRVGNILAVAAGVLLGGAFLAKYAAIYALLGMILAQLFRPDFRLRAAQNVALASAFLVAISPNLIWNIQNDFTTVGHTATNIGWVEKGIDLNFGGLGVFMLSQIFALGPVWAFGVFWAVRKGRDAPAFVFAFFSLPVLAIVSLQAFLDKAYANWAFVGLMTAIPLVVIWVHRARVARWVLAFGFGLNLFLSAIVPVSMVAPGMFHQLGMGTMVDRQIGQAATTRAIISEAVEHDIGAVVSANRAILADLYFTGENSGLEYYSISSSHGPAHYYAMEHPLPDDLSGSVLFIGPVPDKCSAASIDLGKTPPVPAYRRKGIQLWQVDAACLIAQR